MILVEVFCMLYPYHLFYLIIVIGLRSDYTSCATTVA